MINTTQHSIEFRTAVALMLTPIVLQKNNHLDTDFRWNNFARNMSLMEVLVVPRLPDMMENLTQVVDDVDGAAEVTTVHPLIVLYVQLLTSALLSAAVSVFYKKSFKKENFPSLLSLVFLAVAAAYFGPRHPVLTTGCLAIFMIRIVRLNKIIFLKEDFVYFFLTIICILMDIQTGLMSAVIPYNVRVLITACPQFIRKPADLKAMLQGVRNKAGPIYIIYMAMATIEIFSSDCDISVMIFSACGTCSAAVAGVLFRPDNKTMVELLLPNMSTTSSCRKWYHARMMIVSLAIWALIMLVAFIRFIEQ